MATTDHDARTGARITPEEIAAMRARIGYAAGHTYEFNKVATHDAIRHFANGIGDDNPLWCDPSYGPTTRWGTTIAFPLMYMTMGEDQSPPLPDDVKAATKGALSGVHLFHAGTEVEWAQPIRVDDRLTYTGILADVELKESEFAGTSLIEHRHLDWTNQDGHHAVHQHEWFIRTERRESAKRNKHEGLEEAQYTDEELARIDAAYAAEQPRGAEPLWAEDVHPGDQIPGVVKGPLTVTDIISMHMGWGWGGYAFGPSRLGWRHRQRMPRFWTKDRRGAWDVVQRLHWEQDWANEIGLPMRYDYGFMRTAWMIHAITDWMGDDAFLWRFWNKLTRFNFIGDTSWVTGTVVDVVKVDDHHTAELELTITDQRDEVTTIGGAVVILPSRSDGTIQLPEMTRDHKWS